MFIKNYSVYTSEPVVYKDTTHTIGILDITSIDMNIDEENIHRLNEFAKITNKLYGNISIFDLKNIVLHPYGLFKYSKGEKILFINKVENVHYEILAKKLINIINEQNHNISIFYGSIKNKIYKSVEYSEDKYGKCNNNGIGIIKENG